MKNRLNSAEQIRSLLQRVDHLRTQVATPEMCSALGAVKRLQADRFRHTYGDFLADERYAPACNFFLEELYGEHDFAERDEQFSRIANAIERLFPQAVGSLAIDLAETHALTEALDYRMAELWLTESRIEQPYERYAVCWQKTGQRGSRYQQLKVVEHMGQELQRLTRLKPLLMALRMMRKPADLAGLSKLQQFLERGFMAFAHMKDANPFLTAISQRERHWIDMLFDSSAASSARLMNQGLSSVAHL